MKNIRPQVKPLWFVWTAMAGLLIVMNVWLAPASMAFVAILSCSTWACFKQANIESVLSYYLSVSGFAGATLLEFVFAEHIIDHVDVFIDGFRYVSAINILITVIAPLLLWWAYHLFQVVKQTKAIQSAAREKTTLH